MDLEILALDLLDGSLLGSRFRASVLFIRLILFLSVYLPEFTILPPQSPVPRDYRQGSPRPVVFLLLLFVSVVSLL